MPKFTQEAWIFARMQTQAPFSTQLLPPILNLKYVSHLLQKSLGVGSEHQVGAQTGIVICQLLPNACTGPCQQHPGSLKASWQ